MRPEYEPGHLLEKLQAQWPNYIAILASFFYVGIIWLNHRSVFSRVRYCSRSLHLANLLLLLTSALIPFPTALLSTALQHEGPARCIRGYFALCGDWVSMCLSWLLLFHVLSINPHLIELHIERTFFPREETPRVGRSGAVYFGRHHGLGLFRPMLALICFLGLPIFYGITSEGLVRDSA